MGVQSRVHIGSVVRDAAAFTPANWRKGAPMTDPDSLLATVQRLFALLEARRIRYALVGGVALLAYVEGLRGGVIGLHILPATLDATHRDRPESWTNTQRTN